MEVKGEGEGDIEKFISNSIMVLLLQNLLALIQT